MLLDTSHGQFYEEIKTNGYFWRNVSSYCLCNLNEIVLTIRDRELVVCVRRCYGILSFLTFRQQSSSEERDLWNIDKWWVWYSRTCWELWRWRRKRGAVNESFGTHLRSALMTILNNQRHAQWYSKQCGRWSQMRFRISFLSKCAKWEYESEERRLSPWRW